MTNLTLDSYGVQEMNEGEMVNIDGGFIPLIIIGVAFLVSSCVVMKAPANATSTPSGPKDEADSVKIN